MTITRDSKVEITQAGSRFFGRVGRVREYNSQYAAVVFDDDKSSEVFNKKFLKVILTFRSHRLTPIFK